MFLAFCIHDWKRIWVDFIGQTTVVLSSIQLMMNEVERDI